MFITYVKLINHIPFKEDIELHIGDSNFITIKGKTGSGKSYLMNCLHPFSNSSRHFKEYPIYPHKRGYKEIHFEDRGTIFKIRHEYVANSKGSHSCKSYFMKNGEELNENGNNDTFKELVKKFLNYSQEVSNFSILSVKSSGFIDSTPASRSSTLFSLVESDTVKVLKENLLYNITDNNSRIRLYKESRDEVLQGRNIDEDKETVKYYTDLIPKIEDKIEKLSSEREDTVIKLTKFKESTTKIDKESLKSITDYLTSIKDFLTINNINTVNELIKYCSNLDLNLNKLNIEYTKLETNRKELYNKINSMKNRELIKNKIIELNRDLINIEQDIKEVINIDKIEEFGKIEYSINDIVSIISELRSLELYNIKDTVSLNNYIRNLREQVDDLTELMNSIKYAEKIGELISNESLIKCPHCGEEHPILLNIYNGMKEKRTSIEVQNKIISIKNKIDKIEGLFKNLKQNISRILDSNILSDKILIESSINNIDTFLSETLTNGIFKIKDRYDKIKNYLINQYRNIKSNILDLENKIQIYEIYTDDINVLKKEYSNLEEEINHIQRRIDTLSEDKYKIEYKVNLDPYINYSIVDLMDLSLKYKDIFKTIEEYESTIQDKEIEIKNTKEQLEDTKKKITSLNIIIERYLEIYNQLSIYSNKKKDLETIKTVLFQDIPKIILNGNIKYMEDSINTILTQNNIDMTITFNTDEKNGISIPVYVNSKEIPDARALSSGETSLLSTLINTSLLSLLGYRVLLIDELDAHLDTIYRDVFGKIISSICQVLNIDQVFFISHNLNIENSNMIITVGNVEGLDIDFSHKKLIKVI